MTARRPPECRARDERVRRFVDRSLLAYTRPYRKLSKDLWKLASVAETLRLGTLPQRIAALAEEVRGVYTQKAAIIDNGIGYTSPEVGHTSEDMS